MFLLSLFGKSRAKLSLTYDKSVSPYSGFGTQTIPVISRPFPFTIYVIPITCYETNTRWLLSKRYSQYDALRSELLKLRRYAKTKRQLYILASILSPSTSFVFPKKRITQDTIKIKNERKIGLREFAGLLVALRFACMKEMLCDAHHEELQFRLNLLYQQLEYFLSHQDEKLEARIRRRLGYASKYKQFILDFHVD